MSNKKNSSIYTSKSPAGKGDRPRNISQKYWNNFDEINWSNKKTKKTKKRSDG